MSGGRDNEDPVGEEDGYGAFCSHAQSEEIYQDLCSLHLPSPPSVAQVIIFFSPYFYSVNNFLYYNYIRCSKTLPRPLFEKLEEEAPNQRDRRLRYKKIA